MKWKQFFCQLLQIFIEGLNIVIEINSINSRSYFALEYGFGDNPIENIFATHISFPPVPILLAAVAQGNSTYGCL